MVNSSGQPFARPTCVDLLPNRELQTSDLQPNHRAFTSGDKPSSKMFVLIDL
jgi:hypothetical protein